MVNYPKIDSTVAISDIRNFTYLFEIFQKNDNNGFLGFMEEYYSLGLRIAGLVSEENSFYITTAGDGILAFFFEEHHERRAYLYSLLLYQVMEKACSAFTRQHGYEISFGIGAETGYVQKVSSATEFGNLETYLGSVINIAARIEATTKNFHRTKLIIGEKLYSRLIQKLFKEEYQCLVENSAALRKNYDEVIEHHNKMNKLNQDMMLFYVFEHNLKGVDLPLPLFRLSPTLADMRKTSFLDVIGKLAVSREKYNKILSFLEEFSG